MNADQWNKEIYYVDKTLIVETFLKMRHRVQLITAPQGFLKTSNLRLLAAFFDLTSDPKVYMSRRRLFENTKIMSRSSIVWKYFGKFPTIFLTFKHDQTYDLDRMRSMLRQLYKQHISLLSSPHLSADDKSKFSAYLNYRPKAFGLLLRDAVSVLCNLLHKHHKRRVYVFVDNYDSTVLKVFNDDLPMANYFPFLESMLSSIASCTSVNRLTMSGTTSISRLGAVNVTEFKFLAEHKYSKYFGFTERDIRALAIKCSAEVMDELERGGYRTTSNVKLFCPEWVLARLNHSPIENPFWCANIVRKRIFQMPALKTEIRLLLRGEDVQFAPNKRKCAEDVWLVNRLLNGGVIDKLEESDTNLLFTLFLEMGLFNARRGRSTTRKLISLLFCSGHHQHGPELVLNETNRGSVVLKTQFSY